VCKFYAGRRAAVPAIERAISIAPPRLTRPSIRISGPRRFAGSGRPDEAVALEADDVRVREALRPASEPKTG